MAPVAAATQSRAATTARSVKDAVLAGAVDLARAAAEEAADNPGDVGEYLGPVSDSDRLVSHRFACTMRGYRSWYWDVTLSRVPRGRKATVCEVGLLPGAGALLAPAWLPWAQRLQPGDLGPGDVLPFTADDPRLAPEYVPSEDMDDLVALDQLALARVRALSPVGRQEAAERWYRGSRGPTSAGALASAAECQSCGFLVPLQGSLGQVFGVCANAWSPDDGRVVSYDHGCGAHSETDVDPQPSDWPSTGPLIDELHVDLIPVVAAPVESGATEPEADISDVPADAAQEAVLALDDIILPDNSANTDESARPEESTVLDSSDLNVDDEGDGDPR